MEKTDRQKKDEIELLERIKQSDSEALHLLYERYKTEMFAFFYRLEADHQLAEDALQELFLRIWRARARYQPLASVRTFLYTIARNLWINRATRCSRSDVTGLLSSDPDGVAHPEPVEPGRTAQERAEVDEEVALAFQALGQLPLEQRLPFVLAHYQSMPYAEIAAVMEVPVGTIKSRISNAGSRLRQLLGRSEPAAARGSRLQERQP